MTSRHRLSVALSSLLAAAGSFTPTFADEPAQKGYLRAVYSWRIPMFPDCGTSEVFSCTLPFQIEGTQIKGLQDIGAYKDLLPRDLPMVEDPTDPLLSDVFVMPEDPSQVIDYSYRCGACKVSGTILVHQVRGRVVKYSGTESLRFGVTYSTPVCKVDCGSYSFDCSDDERVVDQFMTPVEDGYVVERPENMIFKYLLRLE